MARVAGVPVLPLQVCPSMQLSALLPAVCVCVERTSVMKLKQCSGANKTTMCFAVGRTYSNSGCITEVSYFLNNIFMLWLHSSIPEVTSNNTFTGLHIAGGFWKGSSSVLITPPRASGIPGMQSMPTAPVSGQRTL